MTINIYSPKLPHYPAKIIGSKVSIERLIYNLQEAIKDGKGKTIQFDSNGEQYDIEILIEEDESNYPDPIYLQINLAIEKDIEYFD